MASRAYWDILLAAAEATTRVVDGEPGVDVDAVVEECLPRHPQLTAAEVKRIRHAGFDLARFAALCDGAFQGYCNCFKRNSSSRAAMYLVAFLLTFRYASLGDGAVREMLDGCMPHPRLCEYIQYLFSAKLLRQFSTPLWRTTYDDCFIEEQVIAPLATASAAAAGNVDAWLRGRLAAPQSSGTVPASLSGTDATPTSGDAVTDTGSAKTRSAGKTEPRPPVLHTSSRPRLPPHEVREMAMTVPEPRLPRIKDAPLPARPHATKAPTKAMGFSFHAREASRAATNASATTAANATAAAAAASSSSTTAAGAALQAEYGAGASPRPTTAQLHRMLNRPTAVPTTTAALRREACLRDRQRAHAERALAQLEVVGHDATEYDMWRQAQEEEEERAREAAILQQHLEAVETEERVRARRAHAADLRRRKFRTVRAKYQAELEAHRSAEEAARQQHGEEVQQQRTQQQAGRTAALDGTRQAKAAIAAEVKQESDDRRAAAQEAEEQRKTQQAVLIQEIHLMRQRVREKMARLGDERRLAWADGEADAALGRMSVAELRAALEQVRAEADAEVEERRGHVESVRSRAQAERERLEAECAAARDAERRKRAVKQAQRAQHKAAVEEQRVSRETARMLQLHEKLEARRQEAREAQRATREAERQRRNELLLRAQDSVSMEQGRWRQYEAGLVRRSKWEQQRTMQEAQK